MQKNARERFKITEFEKVELNIKNFINLPKYNEFLQMYKTRNNIPENLFEKMCENFNEETSRKITDQIKNISKNLINIIQSIWNFKDYSFQTFLK